MPRKTKAERAREALERENALNTNRNGILVRPGQMWKDADIRSKGRMFSVSSVEGGIATVYDGKRTTRMAVARMHPHSRGYEIIGSP